MGESIAEGTISKWLKQVGDAVQRDEPLLEISTDKVDAEIPSPVEGVLVEVLVEEGDTVEVGTIVAYVDPEAEAGAEAGAGDDARAEDEEEEPEVAESEEVEAEAPEGAGEEEEGDKEEEEALPAAEGDQAEETEEERLRTRSTPVVRKIAQEHDVDLAAVSGTGHAGRVTKDDILAFLDERETGEKEAPPEAAAPEPTAAEARTAPERHAPETPPATAPSDFWATFYNQVRHPEFPIRPADQVEPMDKIRRLTAEHMVLAKRVSPHVHSFIEVDFTRVDGLRRVNKSRWAEQGTKVSFTAFVVWALSRVLREFPMVNGTISGNNLIYRGNVNVGVAVDLDPGLIVPVIRDADELSLVGIAKRIVDLAERARSRKLEPDEIQGATFSITNPGVLGTLAGMPIIPKGTNGILGTGAIEKRVVVVEDPETGSDSMAIRKRCIFSLGYDHRMVDGADAARFLARLKELMESFPEDA
jgi:2-oxoglutarate dehydrogenase E2 component (dihydrolipoamide succinyltransferase)